MRFLLLIAICTDLRGSQEVLCGRENLPVAFVVSLYNGFLLAVLTPVHLVNEDLCGSAELLLVVGFEFWISVQCPFIGFPLVAHSTIYP